MSWMSKYKLTDAGTGEEIPDILRVSICCEDIMPTVLEIGNKPEFELERMELHFQDGKSETVGIINALKDTQPEPMSSSQ
jgi:hypothetical protein